MLECEARTVAVADRSTISVAVLFGAFALLSVLVGATLPISILALTAILSAAGALAMMALPPYLWAAAGLLLAILSRSLAGFAHPIVNFLHFPLVLGGALLTVLQPTRGTTANKLGRGIILLLAWSWLSWWLTGGDVLKPYLAWFVLAEPFLLVYTLLKANLTASARAGLWTLVLALVLVQLPVAAWQALRHGLGDPVAGTVGRWDVLGAVTMLGVLIFIVRIQNEPRGGRRLVQIACLGALFVVPILAGGKSALGISIIGVLYLVGRRIIRNPGRTLPIVLVSAMCLGTAALAAPFLSQALDRAIVFYYLSRKADALTLFMAYARTSPTTCLIGLGPGNTFSRVALLAPGGLVNDYSPVAWLALSLTPITRAAIAATFSGGYLAATSSIYQIWSSWAGVLGDLGLIGVAIYASLWWRLWKCVGRVHIGPGACARAVILVSMLLGAFYDWLEEPAFILMAAFVVGLSAAEATSQSTRDESARSPRVM